MTWNPIIETDCTITHEGHSSLVAAQCLLLALTASGAGVVYADEKRHVVTTWHGEVIAPAQFGASFGTILAPTCATFGSPGTDALLRAQELQLGCSTR